ncbi:MAG: hypothetical protein MJ233_03840 [Mycoplasmoidaceae bacterium]|nr:hypothetical protein [Mycoplasmoidaceae bacterium]
MGKKFSKFLNVLTFGHLGRKAKKEAARQAAEKNSQLTVNTMELPDVNLVVGALGNIDNIATVSATISTITFQVKDMDKVNFETLKKTIAKGVIKSNANVTILIGDCANALKDAILKLK